jgi:GntR family transcriptional regulator/MocR family aminotransferase
MQGLDGFGRVIYVGTFAKTLFPAMRLGFCVLPSNLADRAKTAINFTGQYAPLVLQAALADFMQGGHFFLHLNRMRRLYSKRRVRFLQLLDGYLGEWLVPIDGRTGMQIAATSKEPIDDRMLFEAARREGINLAPLSLYFHGTPRETGVVMGYAAIEEEIMEKLFPLLRTIFLGVIGPAGRKNRQ